MKPPPRDIEKFLKGYGRIRNISVKEGFGFAEFDDRRDADDAVKVPFEILQLIISCK